MMGRGVMGGGWIVMRGTRVVREGWSFVVWYNRRPTEQARVLLHDLGGVFVLEFEIYREYLELSSLWRFSRNWWSVVWPLCATCRQTDRPSRAEHSP